MDATPFSRAEVEAAARAGELPWRGHKCAHCGALAPDFVELSERNAEELRALIRQSHLRAHKRLRELTGCSHAWAKLWVVHEGRAQDRFFGTGPCLYCGEPLRSVSAQQCRFCLRDWHDPHNIRQLGSSS
jgi:hypothetical protein